MSVGQAIGGIAGAVIGSFVPVVGWAIGAQIGMMAGGYIDPPKGPKIEGPRLSDLNVQLVGYGNPIPRLYGITPTMGTIFWVENNQIKETKSTEEQGGKGGGGGQEVTTYSYSATFAIAICEGPIEGIKRIWVSGKLIYDASATEISPILASREFKGLGAGPLNQIWPEFSALTSIAAGDGFTLYPGTPDQPPDPRMQATLGVANTPAYRGLAYAVFNDFQLADFGNSLMGAQFKFEVIKDGATYTFQNIVSNNSTGTNLTNGGAFYPYIVGINNGVVDVAVVDQPVSHSYLATGASYRPILIATAYKKSSAGSGWTIAGKVGAFDVVATDSHDVGSSGCYTETYDHYLPAGALHLALEPYATTDRIDLSLDLPSGSGVRIEGVMVDQDEGFIGVWFQTGAATHTCHLVSIATGNVVSTHTLDASAISFNTGFGRGANINFTAMTYQHRTKLFAYAEGSLTLAIGLGVLDGANTRVIGMTEYNDWPAASYPSVYIDDGMVYAFNRDPLEYADSFVVMAEVMTASNTTTLRNIVEAECSLSNLLSPSDIDATALTDTVRGYKITNGGALRAGIEPLQAAWPFDVVPDGYQLKFVKRGAASVATVSADELGAISGSDGGQVRITTAREMDVQIPRKVSLTYLDADREYDIGEQSAERLNTDAVSVNRIELPIVLTATEAAGKAEVLLYMYWMERTDLTFVLPPAFVHLQAADVITINATDATYTARLTSVNYLPDGRLECSAKLASQTIYTPAAIGETGLVTGQVLAYRGDSVAALLDIPTISDSYATPGFVAGLYGIWPSWPSGTLLSSSDSGQTWTTLRGFTKPVVAGYVSNSIGSGSVNSWDKKNVLEVLSLSGSFYSTTAGAVLNKSNHFAYGAHGRWEIIGVQSVTEVSAGVYTLRNLLRGRAGTEWAMTMHQVGDTIVRLDDGAIDFIAQTTASMNVAVPYKAVTRGQSIDSAEEVSFTYSGMNLEPLSPVLPKGSKHPSTEDWTLRCTRRTRIDGELRDYVDVPLGETSEAYRWIIYSSNAYSVVKRTVDTTTPALTYTAAQQITDFSATQSDIYFDVAQLSETVGTGQVLRAALSTPSIFLAPIVESLMLYFNGANGSTTFTDSASPPNTVTGSGSVQISTTYSLSGGSSLWVNGGYLTISHAAWMDGGTDPFTLEWFHYEPTLYNSGGVVARRNSAIYCPWELYRSASGTFSMLASSDSTPWAIGGSQFDGVSIVAATWTHIALVYTGTHFQLYVGGTKSVTNMALSDVDISTDAMYIGTGGDASCRAYFEDVRYTPGVALYSANFTPPTSPL